MRFFSVFLIALFVIIFCSLIASIVLQVRSHFGAVKSQAEQRKKLDELEVETKANRERAERRAQESRETQRELLELRRAEIEFRQEQAKSLRELVSLHQELLTALRNQRPS